MPAPSLHDMMQGLKPFVLLLGWSFAGGRKLVAACLEANAAQSHRFCVSNSRSLRARSQPATTSMVTNAIASKTLARPAHAVQSGAAQ